MSQELSLLVITSVSVGFIHTLFGPDHYVPFIVLAKARGWSFRKTLLITFICGVGHIGSSILIGSIGIALGVALNNLISIESVRGSVAAWMMIAFGFGYLIWGIKRSKRYKGHNHLHYHADGSFHNHFHAHFNDHSHIHEKKSYKELTPWILFTIFVFGPCEPFIPILLYPAVKNNVMDVFLVTLTFAISTIGTMMVLISLSLWGFRFLDRLNLQKYVHAIAGGTIFLCGIGIRFMGL